MAMMAKMRSLAPAFILTVGAVFVLFMVISDSRIMEALGGRSNNVGSINGEQISYKEYSSALDRQRDNLKQQSGKDIEDENTDQFRDQVWDAIVTQQLVKEQIEKYNINVTDDEIKETILGDNPPEFLKRNFIDSTGKFNKDLYQQAIRDPQNKEPLIQAEEYVRQTKLNEKLQSLLTASITISEDEIKRKFEEQTTTINSKYALVPINEFPDSAIKVSDNELKKYYDNNIEKYKIEPQRKLKYVLFKSVPSKEDSLTVNNLLENAAENYKKDTLSFQRTAEVYFGESVSKDTVNLTALSVEAADSLSKASPGSLVGPLSTSQGFVLINYIAAVPSKETVVRASHILINKEGSDEKNYEEAMKVYDQLISGADFEKLAKEKSADPGSAAKGGDLGWFGKGAMIPEFEKASFEGKIGVVQKPVKTSYGYHIIKVTGKSDKKYVIEKIVNQIKVSPSTRDEYFNRASDFAYLAEQDGFEKAAKSMNYKIEETSAFGKEAPSIPGIGANKRIVDFAFENSLNKTSEAFKAANGYVVLQVSNIISEGIQPFDDVKNSIKPYVIREMKFEKTKEEAEKIKNKINGELDKAKEINPQVIVSETGPFKPIGNVPTVGRDYAFMEKALSLEKNKISDPIKGNKGYYLIKITERTAFDSSAYQIQRNTIRDQIFQEKKSTFFGQWLTNLKKEADIVDKRYMFYNQQ